MQGAMLGLRDVGELCGWMGLRLKGETGTADSWESGWCTLHAFLKPPGPAPAPAPAEPSSVLKGGGERDFWSLAMDVTGEKKANNIFCFA